VSLTDLTEGLAELEKVDEAVTNITNAEEEPKS